MASLQPRSVAGASSFEATNQRGIDMTESANELTHVPAEKASAVAEALVDFQIDPNYKKWPVLDPDARLQARRPRHTPGAEGRPRRSTCPTTAGRSRPTCASPTSPASSSSGCSRCATSTAMSGSAPGWTRSRTTSAARSASTSSGSPCETCWPRAWRRCCEEYLPDRLVEERLAAADLGRFVGDRPAGDDDLGIDYAVPFAADPSSSSGRRRSSSRCSSGATSTSWPATRRWPCRS